MLRVAVTQLRCLDIAVLSRQHAALLELRSLSSKKSGKGKGQGGSDPKKAETEALYNFYTHATESIRLKNS
jgi:hypothetical protein